MLKKSTIQIFIELVNMKFMKRGENMQHDLA